MIISDQRHPHSGKNRSDSRLPNASKVLEERTFWRMILAVLLAYFIAAILIAIANGSTTAEVLGAVGTIVVAGAAFSVFGGVLGFLFGMPKSFAQASSDDGTAQDGSEDDRSKEGDVASAAERKAAEREGTELKMRNSSSWANDNLVEVSDWLTKVVVGAGLVQALDIVEWIGDTGAKIGQAAKLTSPLDGVIGSSVILVNTGIGFFVMYIFGRTLITRIFANTFVGIKEDLERRVGDIQETQKELEASAQRTQNVLLEFAQGAGGPPAVLAQLYRKPPHGFQEAIRLGNAIVNQGGENNLGLLHGYLACAHGQKFGYEKRRGASAENLMAIADDAYSEVENALAADPERKNWLRSLFDPNDPGHIASEDDLTPLWEDRTQRERFAKLLD